MTLDALSGAAGTTRGLDELLRACSQALTACEQSLRTGVAPRGLPRLRELQEQVFTGLRARPEAAPTAVAALADATDRLANAVDTLAAGPPRRPLPPTALPVVMPVVTPVVTPVVRSRRDRLR